MSVMEWNRGCPIKCGMCCEYGWHYVPELKEAYPGVSKAKKTCPQQSVDGCRLPREERPAACINFLCVEARGVLEMDDEPHQSPEIMDLPVRSISKEKL
jgi:hypothetical protein